MEQTLCFEHMFKLDSSEHDISNLLLPVAVPLSIENISMLYLFSAALPLLSSLHFSNAPVSPWGLLKFHFIISSDLKCSAFVQPPHLQIIYSQHSVQPFRVQLHKGTHCHVGVFSLKCYLNILLEGVLIIYRHTFYCAIIHFHIPRQENVKLSESFHARPEPKPFITCSELNVN